jgi:hypothetical protein
VFLGVTERKRQLLGVDRSVRPWSARPSVVFRGISRQMSLPNFVFELADIRVMIDAKRSNVSWDGPVRDDLMVDVPPCGMTSWMPGGAVSLLAGSRVYFFAIDRCACPEENLRMNGWGDDIDTSVVDATPIADKRALLTGQPLKRRKGKPVSSETKLRDLAGNQECLPDLSCVSVSLVYVLNCGLFEHDLQMSELPLEEISQGATEIHNVVVLDPNLSQRELRAMNRASKGELLMAEGEESGEDNEEED